MMNISSAPDTDLDEIMHTIRVELDRARSAALDSESGSGKPGTVPSVVVTNEPKRKSLAERMDVRILLQRLLGIRRLVKFGSQLERMRQGPIPIEVLPKAVQNIRYETDVVRRDSESLRDRLSVAEETLKRLDTAQRSEANLAVTLAQIANSIEGVNVSIDRLLRHVVDQPRTLDLLKTEAHCQPPHPTAEEQVQNPGDVNEDPLSAL